MHYRFKNQILQSIFILIILLNIGLSLIDVFDFENDHTFNIFILNKQMFSINFDLVN